MGQTPDSTESSRNRATEHTAAAGVRERLQTPSYRSLSVVAIAAVALACGTIVQRADWAQNAHYALVRALADGTPRIDAYHQDTGDKSFTNGHYYSVKAPGLAFVSLPPYLVLRALDKTPSNDTTVWFLNLFTTIPLTVLLLILVRRVADAFESGTGTMVAITLGAATLVLPFVTLYFSHVAAAAFGYAAFYVLFRVRPGPARFGPIALAGLLAGVACVFEYPSAIVAMALAVYALGRDRIVGRIAAYGLGGLLGLAPLLVYNACAFGSPLHMSYSDLVLVGGASGHDVVGTAGGGVYGVTAPSLRVISELLLENRGLLTLTPIVAAGMAGAVLLFRRGQRAEGALSIGLAAAFLLYNSGLATFFGGGSPGPRYLIGALPFVLAPMGLTLTRSPGTTIALALVSVSTMALATITDPMVGGDYVLQWPRDALAGVFQKTVVSIAGGPSGYVAVVPFIALLGLALVAGGATLRRDSLGRRDAAEGATAILLWLLVAYAIRSLVVPEPTLAGAVAALSLTAAAITVQVIVIRALRCAPVPAPQ